TGLARCGRRGRATSQRPDEPEHLVRFTSWRTSTTLPDAPTEAGMARYGTSRRGARNRRTKSAGRVLPGSGRVRLDGPIEPNPLAIWNEVHVGLHRDPISAGCKHSRCGQGYLENAGGIYVRLG